MKEYAKPNQIWIYIDDNKSEYSSIPIGIFKSEKKILSKIYTKEATFKTGTSEFFSQIPNRKNISNEQFHLCEAKIL